MRNIPPGSPWAPHREHGQSLLPILDLRALQPHLFPMAQAPLLQAHAEQVTSQCYAEGSAGKELKFSTLTLGWFARAAPETARGVASWVSAGRVMGACLPPQEAHGTPGLRISLAASGQTTESGGPLRSPGCSTLPPTPGHLRPLATPETLPMGLQQHLGGRLNPGPFS